MHKEIDCYRYLLLNSGFKNETLLQHIYSIVLN
jgi:hypothetical protein